MNKEKFKCKCGNLLTINAGDSIYESIYRWYASYHCGNCGEAMEIDGYDIWDMPDDIKELIIFNDGVWKLIPKDHIMQIKYMAKKICQNLDMMDINTENSIAFYGTRNQMLWLKNRLIKFGIIDSDLDIVKEY